MEITTPRNENVNSGLHKSANRVRHILLKNRSFSEATAQALVEEAHSLNEALDEVEKVHDALKEKSLDGGASKEDLDLLASWTSMENVSRLLSRATKQWADLADYGQEVPTDPCGNENFRTLWRKLSDDAEESARRDSAPLDWLIGALRVTAKLIMIQAMIDEALSFYRSKAFDSDFCLSPKEFKEEHDKVRLVPRVLEEKISVTDVVVLNPKEVTESQEAAVARYIMQIAESYANAKCKKRKK